MQFRFIEIAQGFSYKSHPEVEHSHRVTQIDIAQHHRVIDKNCLLSANDDVSIVNLQCSQFQSLWNVISVFPGKSSGMESFPIEKV